MFEKFRTLVAYQKSRQTGQTQIRMLLKKQSVRVLPACYSDKHFVKSNPDREQKKKSF